MPYGIGRAPEVVLDGPFDCPIADDHGITDAAAVRRRLVERVGGLQGRRVGCVEQSSSGDLRRRDVHSTKDEQKDDSEQSEEEDGDLAGITRGRPAADALGKS
jgi:hypothetical protein